MFSSSTSSMIIAPAFTRTTSTAVTPLYLEAIDYLNRLKTEKKQNSDAAIELFIVLYGKSFYDTIFTQGFFNPDLN